MAKLKNTTGRIFNLPAYSQHPTGDAKGPDGKPSRGETFGGTGVALRPGQTLEVPDWYFSKLRQEKHWGPRRVGDDGVVRQTRRIGSVDPADVEAERKRAAQRKLEREQPELSKRMAELEASGASSERLEAERRRLSSTTAGGLPQSTAPLATDDREPAHPTEPTQVKRQPRG